MPAEWETAPYIGLDGLTDLILSRTQPGQRRLVALAGPPGAGKSTVSDRLKHALNAERPGLADILPMDGYHYDDAVLNARGHRPRKGAPHTFDLGGLTAMLDRLAQHGGEDIAVPVFDRDLEISRAGGRIISATTRVILVEGNYLLLDAEGWRDLKPRFDLTVFVTADPATLKARLTQRWLGFSYDDAMMDEKLEGNDLPNVRLVLKSSTRPDHVLRTDIA